MADKITPFVRIVDERDLRMVNFTKMTTSFHFADSVEIPPDVILLAHRSQAIMKPAQSNLLATAVTDQDFVQTSPLASLSFDATNNCRAEDLLRSDLQLTDTAQVAAVFITAGESKEEIVNGLQTQTMQALQKSWADPAN